MRYLHTDLRYQDSGAVVEVTLQGNEANVLLLDSFNLQNYRRGSRYQYYGGHFTRSPAQLTVPRAGHWHVVVDLGGYGGNVSAGVRVLAA